MAGIVSTTTVPAHATSLAGGVILRAEVLERARDWLNRKPRLTYNNSRTPGTLVTDIGGDHRYGPDCSGLVSMAWHLNPGKSGGLNTRTLGSVSFLIDRTTLEPGDMLLREKSHAVLFEAWESDHIHFSYFSFGRTPMRHYTHATLAKGDNGTGNLAGHPVGLYKAYRYKNVIHRAPAGVRIASLQSTYPSLPREAKQVSPDANDVLKRATLGAIAAMAIPSAAPLPASVRNLCTAVGPNRDPIRSCIRGTALVARGLQALTGP
jgi:hypothetical protein